MTGANVLPRRNRPTTNSYRSAVKMIVETVQADHDLTDGELAERLGCSVGTVRNARNKAGNLDGVTLANVEYEFGPSALDPFLRLGGSRAVPITAASAPDVNPALPLSAALHAIIAAQRPESDGGVEITAGELRADLPELRAARTALDALIETASLPPLHAVAS